jgi:hypothetical protein
MDNQHPAPVEVPSAATIDKTQIRARHGWSGTFSAFVENDAAPVIATLKNFIADAGPPQEAAWREPTRLPRLRSGIACCYSRCRRLRARPQPIVPSGRRRGARGEAGRAGLLARHCGNIRGGQPRPSDTIDGAVCHIRSGPSTALLQSGDRDREGG